MAKILSYVPRTVIVCSLIVFLCFKITMFNKFVKSHVEFLEGFLAVPSVHQNKFKIVTGNLFLSCVLLIYCRMRM